MTHEGALLLAADQAPLIATARYINTASFLFYYFFVRKFFIQTLKDQKRRVRIIAITVHVITGTPKCKVELVQMVGDEESCVIAVLQLGHVTSSVYSRNSETNIIFSFFADK